MRDTGKPPRWATRLLRRAVPRSETHDGLVGDLEELYRERRAGGRRWAAELWYVRQVLSSVLAYRRQRRRPGWGGGASSGGETGDATRPAKVIVVDQSGAQSGASLRGGAAAFRLAARRLLRAPGFTSATTLTLTLGIGIMLVVFAVLNAVALRPLGYPDEDRLVVIEHPLPGFEVNGEVPTLGGLLGQLLHYRERSRTLVEVGGYWMFDAAITDADDPEYLRIGGATGGFFRALGIEPGRGHLFDGDEPLPTEDVRGEAVLGDRLWKRRFGGSDDVLGRVLQTQGFDHEIVGVLPPEMPFPPERAELWNPIPDIRLHNDRTWTVARMVGRMAPGIGIAEVKAELDGLIAELPERFADPDFRRAWEEGRMEAEVTPLKEWLIGEVARPLWLLLGAAAVVFGIGAVNVAGLVAVRAASQRGEVAMRRALGAGRRHIGAHFIAEALLVSLIGGALGLALAAGGLFLAPALSPLEIPRLDGAELGAETVALAAMLAAICTALLSAVSLLVCGRAAATALSGQGRTITPGRAGFRAHNLLVAGQLALSVVLLVGAGLVIRSAASLARVETGFDAERVLSFRLPFPWREIQSAEPGERATPLYDLLAERLAGLPGVTAVGYGSCLPLSPDCALGGTTLRRDDQPKVEGALPVVWVGRASPGYLEALDVPLRAGRPFEPADHQRQRGFILVNGSLAARFWPDGDAVGGRLVQDGRSSWGSLEVVGVVGDVRFGDLRGSPEQIAWLPVLSPVTPQDIPTSSWVVRANGPPMSLAGAVRREVAALRPDLPVADLAPLTEITASSTARLRVVMWLLTIASAVAITLSGVGVYGVVAYLVNLRRRELGIRMVLGARGADLRSLVIRQGVAAALLGLVVGLIGAAFMSRIVAGMIFGVPSIDPSTLAAVVLILSVTAFVAALLPALRAARINPAVILRSDG